jgi:aryl-alcohol dehydrogenase
VPEIQAAVLREKSAAFSIETLSLEEPRDDEVLVRIHGTGVCHTDMVARDQHFPVPLPIVLGHEGAGVVERVGKAVTKVAAGDHVVLSYASCGACPNCRSGRYGYCPELYSRNFSGGRPDGSSPCCDSHGERVNAYFFAQSSFAQYALASFRNVVKIAADVPLHLMGPLGCGIQTGAGAVINALKPGAGTSIAVFGTGSVGLAAVMAAQAVGCTTVIAVDLDAARLKLAAKLGATHVINGRASDPVKEIRAITGDGVQYSIECTGVPAVVSQAVDCLRLTGTCGVVGVAPLGTRVSLDINSILFGRQVRGIIEGDSIPDTFIPQLIELWRQGRFPFDELVSIYPLADINVAIRASETGEVLKAVVRPPS